LAELLEVSRRQDRVGMGGSLCTVQALADCPCFQHGVFLTFLWARVPISEPFCFVYTIHIWDFVGWERDSCVDRPERETAGGLMAPSVSIQPNPSTHEHPCVSLIKTKTKISLPLLPTSDLVSLFYL
jgi:hypothetical protein